MKLRLFHYWRSSCSWRVRWALAIKNFPCEFVPIQLLNDDTRSPEHLQRNPLGYLPVIEVLDSKQKFPFLGESLAIIEWLEEMQPTPSLLPGDAWERARIRQLAEIINSGTQPLQNLNVFQLHSNEAAEQKTWNQHWIRNGLGAYEKLVQKTAGIFSVGNQVTLADLCLIPQCHNALRQEIPLSEFPTIEKIYTAALKTEACQSALPEKFEHL